MGRGGKAMLALLVFLIVGLGESSAPAEGRPVLLLIHSGGFIFGDPGLEDRAAAQARARGWRTESLDYPLWDLPGAVRYCQRAASVYAARGRPVYAYGDSAGGTLAALLAERGEVRAAAALSPVSSIPRYAYAQPDRSFYLALIGATRRQATTNSPAFHRSRRPILALVGEDDYPSIRAPTYRWAKRSPRVRARTVAGGHLGGPDSYGPAMRSGIGYLTQRYRRAGG
jgi:acetyl esterase/lipase